MPSIEENLASILSATYGEDVRDAIHDSIEDIYGYSKTIADEFSELETYETDEYVFHNYKLYKFKSQHSAGVWDSTEVEPVLVMDEIANGSGQAKVMVFDAKTSSGIVEQLSGISEANVPYLFCSSADVVDSFVAKYGIIIKISSTEYKIFDVYRSSNDSPIHYYIVSVSGNTFTMTGNDIPVGISDDLLSISTAKALSARQGKVLSEMIATKQDVLTFDTDPTEHSTNPVASDGVYNAILNITPRVQNHIVISGGLTNGDEVYY